MKKLPDFVASVDLDARIPAAFGNFARSFGELFDGFGDARGDPEADKQSDEQGRGGHRPGDFQDLLRE